MKSTTVLVSSSCLPFLRSFLYLCICLLQYILNGKLQDPFPVTLWQEPVDP